MVKQEETYSVPARFRRIENLHIVFWLIKDLSWAMLWRPIGLFMIIPTLGAAIIITWQTRHIKSELFHNVAVIFWIVANAFWMITEFFFEDSLRFYSVIPFSIGILIIGYYYLFVRRSEKQAIATDNTNVVVLAPEQGSLAKSSQL